MPAVTLKPESLVIQFDGFDKTFDPFDLADKIEKLKPAEEHDSLGPVKAFRDEVLQLPTMTLSQAASAFSLFKTYLEDSKKNIEWLRNLQDATGAEQPK